MCGRFTLKTPTPVLIEHFGLARCPELPPRFNIAPTQDVPVVREDSETGERELSLVHWGLIPFWADDKKVGNRMINARSETAAKRPAFRAAFRRRRCLVAADGLCEWKKRGQEKQPYHIHLADERPFAFAGLWERWKEEEESEPLESCTILTTDANEMMRALHDRMPVLLAPEDYDRWLDPHLDDAEELQDLLEPYPPEEMEAHPVSKHVNNPRNEDPRCVERQEELF